MTRRRLGFWRRFAVAVVKPPMTVLTNRTWLGMEHIPRTGGVIIAANHPSEFDPLVLAHYVYDAGRWPQFLAKQSLFELPVLGSLLDSTRQIPVRRGTADATKALEAAIAAVRNGDAVVIYPEGTTPKRGALWPGRGKTGVARLALVTGAPVIPVVTWGPQRLFDPRTRRMRLRPRTPVSVLAGPPLDLSTWAGATPTAANLYAMTDEIMAGLRDLLARLRDEAPPPAPEPDARRANGAAR